ncbi:nbp1p [Saccharomyces arboricola H-6]|uniref:Nbp1p n=1 Tax=Saccharomyces arboricola (strain H-6 / AS 2.3317 / CBS 10644) TaxID=1160507 RepID=J8PXQ4_SACAR|nr:nbp1p [Saccharomyces arboricola H-6]
MLESVQGLWRDFFGTRNDGRKREYGSLNEIRRRSALRNKRKQVHSTRKSMLRRPRKVPDRKPQEDYGSGHEKTSKQRLRRIFQTIKDVFSNDNENMNKMQSICGDMTKILKKPSQGRPSFMDASTAKSRILRSDAFKRKISELKYNKQRISELRNGSSGASSGKDANQSLYLDREMLLQRQIKKRDEKIRCLERKLQSLQDELNYSNEKYRILEDLLDSSNIDPSYTKSRRAMSNLAKENDEIKPLKIDLSPSPIRKTNSISTSSPMKTHNRDAKVPEMQPLYENISPYCPTPPYRSRESEKADETLSPISVDFSSYLT